MRKGAARRQFCLFLRLPAIGAENAFNFGQFGLVGRVAWAAQPIGPVLVRGEFFAPAGEVEANFARAVVVLEPMMGEVSAVGWGARIVVKMGLFGNARGRRILFDVKDGRPVLARRTDGFAVKMIAPQVAGDAHILMHATGVVRLQVLHHLRDTPFGPRLEDEMNVVGHEAEGVDADAVPAGQAIELVEERDKLGPSLKDALLAASPLVDVINLAHFPIALTRRGAGQSGFFLGEVSHLPISVFSRGKFSYIFGKNRKNMRPIPRQTASPLPHFAITN